MDINRESVAYENKVIERNLELKLQYLEQPLSEPGYKILRAINNHVPNEIKSQRFSITDKERRFPYVKKSSVLAQIDDLDASHFTSELKKLFLQGFVDYQYTGIPDYIQELNNAVRKSMGEREYTEEMLKMGNALDFAIDSISGQDFRLTDRGLLAMIDHGLRKLDDFSNHIKQQLGEVNQSISMQQEKIQKNQELSSEIDDKVDDASSKVERFNENIFTIFSLMIAAFSIIGININSIPGLTGESQDVFVNVLTINASVCFSLVVLFILMNRITKGKRDDSLLIVLIAFAFVFCFVAILYLS